MNNKLFLIIGLLFFSFSSLNSCQNQSRDNYKCQCLPVGHGEREISTADNEYVVFHNSNHTFEILLTYKRKNNDTLIYVYDVSRIKTRNSKVGGMYDNTTIAKVVCKKNEIEFYKSKKYKSKRFRSFEENVYSWRAVGKYKIDKKGNLKSIDSKGGTFKNLKHIESF